MTIGVGADLDRRVPKIEVVRPATAFLPTQERSGDRGRSLARFVERLGKHDVIDATVNEVGRCGECPERVDDHGRA